MRTRSFWSATSKETSWPRLARDIQADAVVIGGGLVGITTAALLADDGARVILVEARRLAGGTTGNTTAKVTALQGTVYKDLRANLGEDHARRYADANVAGVELVARLCERFGLDCDAARVASDVWTADAQRVSELNDEVDSAQRLGLPASLITDGLPYGAVAAVRLDDQLIFHPRRFCVGLANALDGRVLLHENTRVHTIREAGDHVEVETEHGRVTADHAVVATLIPFAFRGAWFARLHPSRSYAIAVALNGEAPRQMSISIDEPIRSVRPAWHEGGSMAIVEGQQHRTGDEPDTRRHIIELESWARDHFDVTAVTHTWSAQDYMSPDRVPFVGPLNEGDTRIRVATGFSKWGMSNGVAAARMLADAIAGTPNPWAETFDASRLGGVSGLKQVVQQGAATLRSLAGEIVRPANIRRFSDLAPGEADVMDCDAGPRAAYRDLDGTLHVVDAKCTHLGCTVA
jgi:glycine/D-amino acid oxidase-like deaminating enzyme